MSQAIITSGRYRLEDYIGSTLLSRVYRAWDLAQERVVVLRLLAPFLNEEEGLLGRFFDEVERVRRLGHAHILPIYEMGRDELAWQVTEYMAGGSLGERVWGPLPLPAGIEVIKQVSQVLSLTQAQGIIHGGIKLKNIFVREDGQVLIADFGMALLRQGVNPLLRASLTTPRPYHLSPEQAKGMALDPRNDVFSLGVLLYQLLTPPSAWGQLASLPIPPPSQANPALPQAIDQVVLKATASQPEKRYQQVAELWLALEATIGEKVNKEASPGRLIEALASPEVAAPPPMPSFHPAVPQWLASADLMTDEQRREKSRRRLRNRLAAALVFLVLVTMSSQEPFFPPQPASNLTAASASGEWAMFQYDPAHSAFLPQSSTLFQGKLKWQVTLSPSQPIFSAPVVHQDTVYQFSGGPRMAALDAATGTIKWEWETPGPTNSSPAIANGLLYIGLRDGRVVAMDTQTKKQVWEFATGNYIFSSPAVWQGILFIGSADGKLYALDALKGSLIWDFPTLNRVISSPAVGNGVVGVGSGDGKVYVVDAFSGKKRIGYIAGYSVDSSPAIDGDTLYIGAGRLLRALNTQAKESRYEKGLLMWWTQLHLQGLAPSPPAQSGFLWATRLQGEIVSSPAIAHDLVYVGTTKGIFYAVDKATGDIEWRFDAQSPIVSAPTVAGNTLLFGDWDGRLHALNARTGEELWQFATQGRILTPPVIAQGQIYLAATDGSLYVLE